MLAAASVSFSSEPEVKVTDVYVVFKTHCDLGFTDLAENVFKRYREGMMDSSLNIIEANRQLPKDQQFVWTLPGWPLKNQILGPKQTPERRAKVERALKEGSIAAHALPATLHTESFDCEDLVRGLGYSSALARQYGHPLPLGAKMTDVPSHSWILPTLLTHAGVKFLHLGCNPGCQYPRVPKLFWWEGADGSRILTGYTLEYGSSLTPPSDWPSKNYLAMLMEGDNHGPPSISKLEEIRVKYATTMPGVKVHFGTLDDFTNAVLAENPALPVVRGDMPDTWIHGLMSMPQTTKVARNIRPLEPALEVLDTQLREWGMKPPELGSMLSVAYENSLLYGEHTWGMNAQFGPRCLYGSDWKKWIADMEAEPIPENGDYAHSPSKKRAWMQSYEDHRNYIRKTEDIVRRELKSRLDLLAGYATSKSGDIIVYNPLPWTRSGLVEADGSLLEARDVPPSGYMVLPKPTAVLQPAQPSDGPLLETAFFKATFDLERGGISSLVEKSTGRELADRSSPYAIGQFLHERFSSKEVFDGFLKTYGRRQSGWVRADLAKPGMPDAEQIPYLASTPSNWRKSVAHHPTADIVTLTAGDAKGLGKLIVTTFTLPLGEASVEVEWKVTDKTPEKHPEGGWLCFPFAVEKPTFTVGRPGGPINPAADIVPGANRYLMAVTSGVAMTGANGSGVALCPIDSPLISMDRPGLWRWSLDFVPEKPTIFVNLYNNMWNTNFPLWQDGSWSERVRFWPTSKGTATVSDLTVKSWEARLPLLAVASAGTGSGPASQAGLSVSRPGAVVTAFGQNPDGEGTVLRVWEQAGIAGELTVQLPSGSRFHSATPVSLRGEKTGRPIQVVERRLTFRLKAYSPASFILKR